MGVEIAVVGAEAAAQVYEVIAASFGARPVLDPPASALEETEASVASALDLHGGLLACRDGAPVAALIFAPVEDWLGLRRVGVMPSAQGSGVAGELVGAAEEYASTGGYTGIRLVARADLPATVRFWRRHGYVEVAREDPLLQLRKRLPVAVDLPDLAATEALGMRLASRLRAGDLVILTGGLGAGKTTLTQSIGRALGVRGEVTSPTFVISRVHPPLAEGPALVHVDAYRLGDAAELDDLDLDTDLDTAVTVVEWGAGLADHLAEDRLEVVLSVDPTDESRRAVLVPYGRRWNDAELSG